MAQGEADDVGRPPTDVLAQMMLACVRDTPALTARSRGTAGTRQCEPGDLPALCRVESTLRLPASAEVENSPYLEELVSMATVSIDRANEAIFEANEARRRATRAAWTSASIAAVGIAVGVAGMASHFAGASVSNNLAQSTNKPALTGDPPALLDDQPSAPVSTIAEADSVAPQSELAPEIASATTTSPNSPPAASANMFATASAAPITPATPPAPTSPSVSPNSLTPWPTWPPPVVRTTYSAPGPSYRQPMRRIPTTQRSRVVLPGFIIVLRRNIRALF